MVLLKRTGYRNPGTGDLGANHEPTEGPGDYQLKSTAQLKEQKTSTEELASIYKDGEYIQALVAKRAFFAGISSDKKMISLDWTTGKKPRIQLVNRQGVQTVLD
jgi:hypothetical protein